MSNELQSNLFNNNNNNVFIKRNIKLHSLCPANSYNVNTDTNVTEPSGESGQRCPYYRDRECIIFGISGTKRTVRNIEVSVLWRCP